MLVTQVASAQCPTNYNADATVTSAMGSCGASGNPVTQGFAFGTQTLTIEAGATLTITGDFQVWDDVIVYGTLIVTNDMDIISSGSLSVAEGGYVEVGGDFTNGGYFTSGSTGVDGTMVVAGDFENRSTGSVNVGENGSLQTGSFTNDGGSVSVAGGDTDCTTNGCCGDCSLLPIVLVDFQVVETNGYADLRWTTAQEIDNDYFEVYKLTDETDQFVVIGIIDGQGTTKVKTTYQFIDKDFDSDAYYQIRQVDFDGQSETFGPIALSKETSVPLNLEIYPNPSSGPIQLSGSGYTGFSIHNMRGQLIRMEPNRMGEEAEEIINSALLSSKGTFFLTFWNGEEKVVKRIIKR